jgi:hypothetical protein
VKERGPPLLGRILERLVYGPLKLPDAPEGSAEYFHQEVSIVMHLIFRHVGPLRDFSLPAMGAAFAMHLVAIFSKCVADGSMTAAEAQHLVIRIAKLEFDPALMDRLFRDAEKNDS